jgi:hypothetical protein
MLSVSILVSRVDAAGVRKSIVDVWLEMYRGFQCLLKQQTLLAVDVC